MGASVATNYEKSHTSLMEESISKCPSVSVSGKINIKHMKFDPPATCKDSNFDINQTAGVDADCLMKTMQEGLINKVIKSDTSAQAGVGFSKSTNETDIKNDLTAKLVNDCGSVSASQETDLYDLNIRACNFKLVQGTNAKSRCELNSIQKLSDKLDLTTKTKAEGITLFSPLIIGGVVIACGVFLLLAILIIKLFSSSGQRGGGNTSMLIVALFLAIIWYTSSFIILKD